MEDFTLKNYENILDIARQNYVFISFDRALSLTTHHSVIWRHDIDFSVTQATKMAGIEKNKGISSTFFVQLSSKFYNVFEHEVRDSILNIMDSGHSVGLHFDPSLYLIPDVCAFEEKLLFEKEILEKLLGKKIQVFSLHMPTACKLELDGNEYAGMINAYGPFFKKNYKYCSDSNGYWRFERLDKVIEMRHKYLHVLTHPVWWTEDVLTPMNRVRQCIEMRGSACEQWYLDVIKKFNRKG